MGHTTPSQIEISAGVASVRAVRLCRSPSVRWFRCLGEAVRNGGQEPARIILASTRLALDYNDGRDALPNAGRAEKL